MADVQVPILKDTKDPHYRYKMPKLTAKVEGSGNGIRTVITNMTAIAKALGRPATYPTKYFGCELGAQVTMNNEYVVNGSHDPDKLMKLLYDFIRKFVLCNKCNNPETTLTVSNKSIRQKCIACGHEYTIPNVIHKLTTYIINHPPEGSGSTTNGTSGKVKSGKSEGKSKSKRKGGKEGNDGSNSPTNSKNADSGDNFDDNNNNDIDDFDEEELTTDAYKERMRELRGEAVNPSMYINDTKENADIFYQLVKEKKEANLLQDAQVQKELLKEAERLEIKDKSTLVLSELLFTENMIEEIKLYRMLFLRFCNENKKAQKYLLGGFEKIVGDVLHEKLFNSSPLILKQFYDEDIIEEETILEWSAKSSKKYVNKEMSKKIHEKVEPFVKWLKEAEVEEDDEEEDDSEEDKKKTPNGGTAAKSAENHQQQQRKASLEDDENDDDLFEFSHRVSGLTIESVKPAVVIKPINADVVADATANGKADEEEIDIDDI